MFHLLVRRGVVVALVLWTLQVMSLVAGDCDKKKEEPSPKPKPVSERIVGYWKFEAEIDPQSIQKFAEAKNISIKRATEKAEFIKEFVNGNQIVFEFGKEGTGKSYTTVYVGAGNREIRIKEFT